jgi:hypothetical protein
MYTRCGQQFLWMLMCQPSGVRAARSGQRHHRQVREDAFVQLADRLSVAARTTNTRTTMCSRHLTALEVNFLWAQSRQHAGTTAQISAAAPVAAD